MVGLVTESAGKCFRLYANWLIRTNYRSQQYQKYSEPTCVMSALMLKSLGIDDLLNFDFMDPPPAKHSQKLAEKLYALGAFNQKDD